MRKESTHPGCGHTEMDMAKQNVRLQGKPRDPHGPLTKDEAGKVVTYRILIIVLADLILGSLLDYIRVDSTREYRFVFEVCPWLVWVCGAVWALSAIYLVFSLVKKMDTRRHPITPAMIFALCLFVFAVVLLYKSITMMMIISTMVIASVLFVLYYIYTNLLY